LGLNNRLEASKEHPVRLYFYDFDGNGKKDQVLTYYLKGKEIPFANKDELTKQMPALKKKFLYAEDFAKATLNDIFGKDKLTKAQQLSADYFANAILINNGNLQFTVQALPWQAQLAPYKDAIILNSNRGQLPDILLAGNYYDNNIQMGRYDADYGIALLNRGQVEFDVTGIEKLALKGQIRKVKSIRTKMGNSYVLATNSDTTRIIQIRLYKHLSKN